MDYKVGCWYVFDMKTRECIATMIGERPAAWDLEKRNQIAIQDVKGLGNPGELMCFGGKMYKKVMLNGS